MARKAEARDEEGTAWGQEAGGRGRLAPPRVAGLRQGGGRRAGPTPHHGQRGVRPPRPFRFAEGGRQAAGEARPTARRPARRQAPVHTGTTQPPLRPRLPRAGRGGWADGRWTGRLALPSTTFSLSPLSSSREERSTAHPPAAVSNPSGQRDLRGGQCLRKCRPPAAHPSTRPRSVVATSRPDVRSRAGAPCYTDRCRSTSQQVRRGGRVGQQRSWWRAAVIVAALSLAVFVLSVLMAFFGLWQMVF